MQSTLITRVLFVCGNRSGRDVACMFDEKMQVIAVIVYENAAIRYFNMRYNISAETKLRNNLKFDCTLSRRRDGFLCFVR